MIGSSQFAILAGIWMIGAGMGAVAGWSAVHLLTVDDLQAQLVDARATIRVCETAVERQNDRIRAVAADCRAAVDAADSAVLDAIDDPDCVPPDLGDGPDRWQAWLERCS